MVLVPFYQLLRLGEGGDGTVSGPATHQTHGGYAWPGAMESQYLQMVRLQLLGVLADIFVLSDLARLVELEAPAPDRSLIDAQDPGNVVVVEL